MYCIQSAEHSDTVHREIQHTQQKKDTLKNILFNKKIMLEGSSIMGIVLPGALPDCIHVNWNVFACGTVYAFMSCVGVHFWGRDWALVFVITH